MGGRSSCPVAGQAVGWVMRALEPVDEEAFVEHLPYCHICQEAVQQTEELMRLVASADEQVDPGPELRQTVLAAVAATPQTPRAHRAAPWPNVAWGQVESRDRLESALYGWEPPRPSVPAGELPPMGGRRVESPRRRGMVILLAAVAFALVGIGGVVARSFDGAQQQQAVHAQAEAIQRVLAQVKTPGSRYAILAARSGAPVAAVLLDGGERRLVQIGVLPSAPGHVYVLWGTGTGKPIAVGTFDAAAPGDQSPHSLGAVNGVDSFPGYAITLENGNQAPQSPSLVVIASGQVTS